MKAGDTQGRCVTNSDSGVTQPWIPVPAGHLPLSDLERLILTPYTSVSTPTLRLKQGDTPKAFSMVLASSQH